MKRTFVWLTATSLSIAPLIHAQDPDKETDEQLKEAAEAAKKMDVQMPDIKKLLEEDEKETSKEKEQNAAKNANGKKDGADGAQPSASTPSTPAAPAQPSVNIPAGTAKGSLTYDDTTSELKFGAAFVDQKDERKPVVVLITDQKLPSEKWKSEFDMMLDHTKWSGLVFFLDKEGTIYRTDVHTKGRQASVSGIFDVKIDNPTSKDLAGTVKAKEGEKETKLDVAFHATLK